MGRKVVVKQKWKSSLVGELTIEVAIEVVDFGLHGAKRFQKHIRVPLEQIPKVNLVQMWSVLLDQAELFDELFAAILQGHLGVHRQHALDMTGLHIVMHSQIVKQTDHRLCLHAKKPSTFDTLQTHKQSKQVKICAKFFNHIKRKVH